MDIWQDATLRNCYIFQQFVEFFIVADRKAYMSWSYSRFLVISRGISSQLQNFGGKVLQDCSLIYCSRGVKSFRISTLSEVASNTAHWEYEPSSLRLGLSLFCCLFFLLAFVSVFNRIFFFFFLCWFFFLCLYVL